MKKKVLITGASGGFGKLIVNKLLKEGHTVVASMRGVAGKNKETAEELQSAGAKIVEIDVTSDESVNSGVAKAIELAGGLDVVINNAGVGVIGLQEAFTSDDMQKLFDINVFGVHRVNKAILPKFRANKSGLVVNISSLLGRTAIPFNGPYNATKWALEALTENYRAELSKFGVDVVVVEPGGFPTTFHTNLMKPSDNETLESYGDFAKAPEGFINSFGEVLEKNPQQDPQKVADAVAEVIATPAGQRKFRTVVDEIGMGEHIKPYNEHFEKLTDGIYNSFGIGDMLKLKTD